MKSIALLAVAGLATVASAQDVNASDLVVDLTWSANNIAVGDTVTGTLTASWVGASTSYLSSTNISLLADNAIVDASDTAAVSWNLAALGFDGIGSASGADILNLDAAQFSLFAPVTNQNPIVITTFQVTATAEGALVYSIINSDLGTKAAFTVSDTAAPTANPVRFNSPRPGDPAATFNAETLTVIPAPSAMALLGLGGLVATRRRR